MKPKWYTGEHISYVTGYDLDSGRFLEASAIGIDDDLTLLEGDDGIYFEDGPQMDPTVEEEIEIANYLIGLWQQKKAKAFQKLIERHRRRKEMIAAGIPEISDERLFRLAEKLRAVKHVPENWHQYYFGLPADLRKTSYLGTIGKDQEEALHLDDLYEAEIVVKRPNDNFYAPSVADVLSQIPEEYDNGTVAFEVFRTKEQHSSSLPEKLKQNDGYHFATLRLYKRAK